MTNQEKVRKNYPKARAKRYRLNGGGGYNLIWADSKDEVRLAEGKTSAEAWKNAANKIKERSQQAHDIALQRGKDEVLLDECGWVKQQCGFWEDPITHNHVEFPKALQLAKARRRSEQEEA